MEANLENLKKAMSLCAEAHKAEFMDWSEDGQLGIDHDSVPTMSDVKEIMASFMTPFGYEVVSEWGYVNVYLNNSDFRKEVDVDRLSMALPYGWVNERMNK